MLPGYLRWLGQTCAPACRSSAIRELAFPFPDGCLAHRVRPQPLTRSGSGPWRVASGIAPDRGALGSRLGFAHRIAVIAGGPLVKQVLPDPFVEVAIGRRVRQQLEVDCPPALRQVEKPDHAVAGGGVVEVVTGFELLISGQSAGHPDLIRGWRVGFAGEARLPDLLGYRPFGRLDQTTGHISSERVAAVPEVPDQATAVVADTGVQVAQLTWAEPPGPVRAEGVAENATSFMEASPPPIASSSRTELTADLGVCAAPLQHCRLRTAVGV